MVKKLILLFIGLIILALLLPSNRLLYILMAGLMFVLIAFNTDAGDYDFYRLVYNNPLFYQNASFSISENGLYFFLIKISHSLGVHDFVIFNALTSGLTMMVLLLLIQRFSSKPNIVLILTLIYPFVDFVIQKRNFVALSVVYLVLYYFLMTKHGTIQKLVVSLFSLLLIFGIHSSTVVYGLYFFVFAIPEKYRKTCLALGTATVFIGASFLPQFSRLLIDSARVNLYLEDTSFRLGVLKSLFFVLIHLMYIGIQYYIYKIGKRKLTVNSMAWTFNEFAWLIALTGVFVFPLYFYNATFFRIPRNLFPFLFISLSNVLEFKNYKIPVKTLLLTLFLFALQLLVFKLQYDTGNRTYDELVRPVLEDNSVVEWFDFVLR